MKQELQSFLGAVNYLQTFVPHLSSNTEPLRTLLKKENCFAWDENTNTCFQKIKSPVRRKPSLRPLRYYDQTKPVTLQCDGLTQGAGSLHHSRRTAHCICQQIPHGHRGPRYTNIERELLAIVYGCKKFHTYLYRRTFIMETDHKPLEMISFKESHSSPPTWLQRMLLHLQQYDLVITYWPGKEMLLVDALSCLPSRTNTEIKLDLQVNAISMFTFSQRCLTKIAAGDSVRPHPRRWCTGSSWMVGLTDKVMSPRVARLYWSFWDELLHRWRPSSPRGERVVILPSCRDSIMADLHGNHIGINKAMDLARTCVLLAWHGSRHHPITSSGAWHVLKAATYQWSCCTPMRSPPGPWGKNRCWLLSRPFGEKAPNSGTTTSVSSPYVFPVASTHHFKTISHLRELFAAEGMPAIIMSDNGPPFNEDEFKAVFPWLWLHSYHIITPTSISQMDSLRQW